MSDLPILSTPRLLLRPFTLDDAPAVQALASAREVAATTLTIPHPYPEGEAARWIGTHRDSFETGTGVMFAVVVREENRLAGGIGLRLQPEHASAELGYWIGVPYWNHGYATEAARAVIAYGFEARGLERIHAHYFAGNAASGRVMEKIGMTREGLLRLAVKKWGNFENLLVYSILREEYLARKSAS